MADEYKHYWSIADLLLVQTGKLNALALYSVSILTIATSSWRANKVVIAATTAHYWRSSQLETSAVSCSMQMPKGSNAYIHLGHTPSRRVSFLVMESRICSSTVFGSVDLFKSYGYMYLP